ncbi:SDR family NAD(P)-dependent oxidoreductase, partial [Staphylococcus aureus]|uniref:SDR family NAD(P)-dependent oxidoreductase n=1 Tax=Staphylococcus aureus TaxID=1280 RepID=UPI00168077C0
SETVDKIKSNGDNAKADNVDISDEQQVGDFVSDIKEQFGRIDVLFNNAGVDNAAGRIHGDSKDGDGKNMEGEM